MKKPEKKTKPIDDGITPNTFEQGYNQACDEWEEFYKQEMERLYPSDSNEETEGDRRFKQEQDRKDKRIDNLPSEEEIYHLLKRLDIESPNRLCLTNDDRAEAISKRIKGEK